MCTHQCRSTYTAVVYLREEGREFIRINSVNSSVTAFGLRSKIVFNNRVDFVLPPLLDVIPFKCAGCRLLAFQCSFWTIEMGEPHVNLYVFA